MDDTVSECDRFDTEIDQLQARRQNSDQYDKKKETFKKSNKLMLADKHDAQYLLEDNLYRTLHLKQKKEYLTLLDRKECPRCKILKEKFIKAFLIKYPVQKIGTVPSPRNRFSHLYDVKDTPDDTSLASHISEDSITSAPEGHEKMYNDFTQYQEESTIHNRRFSTLGYWTPEPEHVRNSPITGKPYPDDEIKEELQELE